MFDCGRLKFNLKSEIEVRRLRCSEVVKYVHDEYYSNTDISSIYAYILE